MCSWASLPSLNRTMATSGTSTPLSCRSKARQHPVHPDGMRELEHHFIHYLIIADSSRDGRHFRIGRHLGNETLRVKLAQLVPADTPGQHWDMVHVGVLNHGGDRVLGVMGYKLMSHMLLPELAKSFLSRCEVCV